MQSSGKTASAINDSHSTKVYKSALNDGRRLRASSEHGEIFYPRALLRIVVLLVCVGREVGGGTESRILLPHNLKNLITSHKLAWEGKRQRGLFE